MQIIVAKNAGFCKGVQNAINSAYSIEGGCYTFGNLIHNEIVLKQLEENNIHAINSLDEFKGGTLLIRTHGVGKDVYDELEKRGIHYIDATCPFVKRIHDLVKENYDNGKKIIIIGDKNHPEVVGTNGWCNYEGIIISNEKDVESLDPNLDYFCVAQTTFDSYLYKNIINLVKNKVNLVANANTICYTTTGRQEEAEKLSKKCDLMLVIGSKTSSNTTKLFNICSNNCSTYLIENLADLKSVEYKNNNVVVGIVAGASTPQELIMEVKRHMSESQENKKNTAVESGKTEFELAMAKLDVKSSKGMQIKSGDRLNLTVISADANGIKVNFNGKKDGFIAAADAEAEGVEYNPANYKEGDSIRAQVIDMPKGADATLFYFSKKIIDQKNKDWDEYAKKISEPEFKVTVSEVATKTFKNEDGTEVKRASGLKAKFGPYDVFIPSSQVKGSGFANENELAEKVGKELTVRAIKSNKDGEGDLVVKPHQTVFASAKVILEEKKAAKKAAEEKAFNEFFEVGKVVNGKVTKFETFGAFVKVNGFECLAHVKNLSYNRNAKPEDVLELNKTYSFVILDITVDGDKRRVSLGYKQLQKSLYEEAFEKYPLGSTVTGPVKSVTNYGAYVQIEDGVDGLVPVGEISRQYVKDPADFLKVDQEVTAQIIKFDVAKGKITLSIKALLPEEEVVAEEAAEEHSARRNSRNLKKFETADAPKKKSKKAEVSEEPQTYSTGDSEGVSLGSLLKDLGLDGNDD